MKDGVFYFSRFPKFGIVECLLAVNQLPFLVTFESLQQIHRIIDFVLIAKQASRIDDVHHLSKPSVIGRLVIPLAIEREGRDVIAVAENHCTKLNSNVY